MRRPSTALAILALAVAACAPAEPADPEEAPAPEPVELQIRAVEFAFDPSTGTVPAGAEVTVTLVNQGAVEHDWVLLAEGVRVAGAAEVGDEDELANVHANAGETATVTFTAPAAGTYQVICSIPGHLEAGMEGELSIQG